MVINRIIFFIMLLSLSSCLEKFSEEASVNRTIENIRLQFSGLVIEKYSTRKNVGPTHLKLKLNSNDTIKIVPIQEVTDNAQIGDSIVKNENENFVFIIKPDGSRKKYFYIKISSSNREHELFPKDWKKKWMDDKLEGNGSD